MSLDDALSLPMDDDYVFVLVRRSEALALHDAVGCYQAVAGHELSYVVERYTDDLGLNASLARRVGGARRTLRSAAFARRSSVRGIALTRVPAAHAAGTSSVPRFRVRRI